MLQRPQPTEHDPYYGLYIDQAPEGDILTILENELETTLNLLGDLPEERAGYRYADDKWSIREVIGHLIDTEWTFTYRCLCFARRDPASLPGFDQDHWARVSNADHVPLAHLLNVFTATRRSSVAIFGSFDDEIWARSGVANEVSFSVRSMPYILAGHEIHHRKVLVERYGL
ncbi:MAG: DinB family protein [Acidobacteriota bacterium]